MCSRWRVERDHARTGRVGDSRRDTRKISRDENDLSRRDQIQESGYAHRMAVVQRCWLGKGTGIVENRDFIANEKFRAAHRAAEFRFDDVSAIHSIESSDELTLLMRLGTAKKIYEFYVHAL